MVCGVGTSQGITGIAGIGRESAGKAKDADKDRDEDSDSSDDDDDGQDKKTVQKADDEDDDDEEKYEKLDEKRKGWVFCEACSDHPEHPEHPQQQIPRLGVPATSWKVLLGDCLLNHAPSDPNHVKMKKADQQLGKVFELEIEHKYGRHISDVKFLRALKHNKTEGKI